MNLAHIVSSYGYIGLFVMLAIEYIILVVPGETTLTTAGILFRSGSVHFNFVLLVLATGLGTFAGSMLAYGIGRLFGRPLLLKYGKYVMLTPKRLASSEALFQKHTILTLIISKYIAVVRDIVPYIAGINRIKLRVFIPFTLLASFMWTATFLGAGGLIGELWKVMRHHWRADLVPAIVVVALLGVGYWFLHKRLHRLTADTDGESADTNG